MKPWLQECWVIPPQANAEFVGQRSEILELYTRPYNPAYPLVCFDESCKQLISEIRQPLTAEPGKPEGFDYQYEREGVSNLFMFFEPLKAWRHVEVTSLSLTDVPALTMPNK